MAESAQRHPVRLFSRRRVAIIISGLALLVTSLSAPSWHARRLVSSRWPAMEPAKVRPRSWSDAAAAPRRRTKDCRKDFEGILPIQVSIPIMVALTLMSAMFTAMTLGLMGMDTIGLQIVKDGDDPKFAAYAKKIVGIRKNGNQLMCTLMMGNVASNCALAILAADATSIFYGLLISLGLILLLGEILPQAICTKYTLQAGAALVPVAYFFMLLLWIISKPLSLLVYAMLGEQLGTVRGRTELIAKLQALGKQEMETGAALADQIAKQVAEGALSFRTKCAEQVMTPLEDAYMLPSTIRLGYTTIREIFETGFTRIPVYGADKHEYLGLLVTKDLMLADPEDEMQVGDFIKIFNRTVETFFKETQLVEVLNKFKNGGTHMGLVREVNTTKETAPLFEISGVVTLEDVIEEILQEEIVDETDVYKDVDNQIKVEDGREDRVLHLGVFNPLWRSRRERLSIEEVATIATHLQRITFGAGSGLDLSYKAIEWLVTKAGVQNRERSTPWGQADPQDADVLYEFGKESDRCTLILQGRVSIRAGTERFRSEAGAFTVLARDALLPGDTYVPDFVAFLHTQTVRIVVISKTLFLEALALDKNAIKLDLALQALASEVSVFSADERHSMSRAELPSVPSPRGGRGKGWASPTLHLAKGTRPISTPTITPSKTKDTELHSLASSQ